MKSTHSLSLLTLALALSACGGQAIIDNSSSTAISVPSVSSQTAESSSAPISNSSTNITSSSVAVISSSLSTSSSIPSSAAVSSTLESSSVVASSSSSTSSSSAPNTGEVLAFPGAEGFGRFSTGGRGGDVYHVTNLKDSGVGSLRDGVNSANGPRTIVFDVSGNIQLDAPFTIKKDNLTIAGQTAPAGGITVSGYNTLVEADNVIIRFMRFRCGDFNVQGEGSLPAKGRGDLKGSNADAISIINSRHVIFDHVSASWSIDESLSVTWSNDITVQNSIISEPLKNSYHEKGAHGFGSLVRANNNDQGGYTYYRNLYAHCDMRNPGVGPNQESPTVYKVKLDFVNNIIYGWGQRQGESIDGSKNGRAEVNMVNNYYIASADSDDPNQVWDDEKKDAIYAYQSGNKVDSNKNGVLDGSDQGWAMFAGFASNQKISSRWNYPTVTTVSADAAYTWVKNNVGASLQRDAIDTRLIQQMQTNTGSIIDSQDDVGGLPNITSKQGPTDTDKDGMPDNWEDQKGLKKSDANDRNAKTLDANYTNLEVYLNSLVVY